MGLKTRGLSGGFRSNSTGRTKRSSLAWDYRPTWAVVLTLARYELAHLVPSPVLSCYNTETNWGCSLTSRSLKSKDRATETNNSNSHRCFANRTGSPDPCPLGPQLGTEHTDSFWLAIHSVGKEPQILAAPQFVPIGLTLHWYHIRTSHMAAPLLPEQPPLVPQRNIY